MVCSEYESAATQARLREVGQWTRSWQNKGDRGRTTEMPPAIIGNKLRGKRKEIWKNGETELEQRIVEMVRKKARRWKKREI